MKKQKIISVIIFQCLCLFAFSGSLLAQKGISEMKAGNDAYNKGDYKNAEILYRKAIEAKGGNFNNALFNLGDAFYKQKNYADAAKIFQSIIDSDAPSSLKANSFHNLGNCYLQQQKYQESIDSYKKSLKLKPADNDTKYNLEYAKKKLIQQQQQQQQQNQEKQQQQQQQQQQDNQKKNQDKQQQNQSKPNEISKEDAERMLNALKNKEKNLVKEKKEDKNQNSQIEKDW
jgi:tetratricopeptide (TPR) repeat protein